MGKPEIRFKGYTDEWEQRKLGDVAQEFKSGNSLKADEIDITGDYPVYGGNGLRGYTSTYNHDGEYALIGRQGALCGNMNYSAGKAYFTEHAVVVKADENNVTRFLYYMLDTMNLGQYSDQSAQPGLAVNKLVKLENSFPKKEEQQQIGAYFRSLDHLITLHQRKCDEVKSLKKYMLQKMFPQNEQKVPEIRFEGFTEAWEQRKLGEVTQCLDSERVPINSEEREKIPGEIPYYGAGNIQGYINKFLFDEELVLLLEDGDAFDDFRTKEIAQYICGKTWVNNHAHVLRPLGDAYFLYVTLSHKDIRNWVQLAGASRKKLVQKSMLNIELFMPHIIEQKKIGQYFSNLDHLITLHQRKPIPHPNHPTIHTKHKGEEKYVRIRVNDRGKINRTANLRRFPVDIPGGFKDGGRSVGEFQIYSGAE